MRALLREWLLELKVMGRSPADVDWYAQKMDWYRRSGGVENLEELNAFEFKRFLTEQLERGLSDNTIHGFFQVIRALPTGAPASSSRLGTSLSGRFLLM